MKTISLCLLASLVPVTIAAASESAISRATTDEHGFLVHEIECAFQEGKTQIRVLLPDAANASEKYPAIYVLPVEAKNETRYGDGLLEVKKLELHNRRRAVFIAPSFSHLPWYADHPSDSANRQEGYLLNVVLPFVEKTYPVQTNPQGRLLLGFSKSGWGAWSLLLRHPDVFGRAAAWDAPLMMDRPGKYGSSPIFGTEENFKQYRVTDLLRAKAESIGPGKRLILAGAANFHQEHEQMHVLLDSLKIPHEYRDGPQRKHDWHSGWVPEAVELLTAPLPN